MPGVNEYGFIENKPFWRVQDGIVNKPERYYFR